MVRLLSVGITCLSTIIFLVPAVLIWQYFVLKQRSIRKWFMVLLLAIYFMAVFSVTGLPSAYSLRFNLSLNLVPFADIVNNPAEYVKNTLLNIVLFMPLGFLLPVIWRDYRSAKTMVIVGFAVSFVIETLQVFTFRHTDVDDLIMNTLGTVAGYAVAKRISFGMLLKMPKDNGAVLAKYEPVIVFGMVFLIGFLLKPLVENAVWEAVWSGTWWEHIR